MSKDYRINAQDIVEKGIQQVEFDPTKVELFVDDEYFCKYRNCGRQTVRVKYNDEDLARLMGENNYSITWAKTIFNEDQQERYYNRKGIVFRKSIESNLRKKPNVDGQYTENSIKKFKDKAKEMIDKYNLKFVTDEVEKLIAHFNEWYAEEQKKKVVSAYGDIYAWKWETVEEIVDMDVEIKALEEELKQLRNKKFDRQCTLAVEFIKDKAEKIAEEFKQPLVDEINRKRAEGYKSPWFR